MGRPWRTRSWPPGLWGGESLPTQRDAGTDALHALLVPYPAEWMEAFSVGKWVGDPKHEGPRCLEPLGA